MSAQILPSADAIVEGRSEHSNLGPTSSAPSWGFHCPRCLAHADRTPGTGAPSRAGDSFAAIDPWARRSPNSGGSIGHAPMPGRRGQRDVTVQGRVDTVGGHRRAAARSRGLRPPSAYPPTRLSPAPWHRPPRRRVRSVSGAHAPPPAGRAPGRERGVFAKRTALDRFNCGVPSGKMTPPTDREDSPNDPQIPPFPPRAVSRPGVAAPPRLGSAHRPLLPRPLPASGAGRATWRRAPPPRGKTASLLRTVTVIVTRLGGSGPSADRLHLPGAAGRRFVCHRQWAATAGIEPARPSLGGSRCLHPRACWP